jgi:hypothetical protein
MTKWSVKHRKNHLDPPIRGSYNFTLRAMVAEASKAAVSKAKVAIVLALAFIALNIVDILLTWQALPLGASEVNFFMRDVLALGYLPSIAFKLGISSGIAALMLYRGQFRLLIAGVSIICFVCVWNSHIISGLS